MVDDKENKEKDEISDKVNKAKLDLNFTLETLPRWQRFEGYSINFYLDGVGYITIGMGCVIPDAVAAIQLNLLHKYNDTKAINLAKIQEERNNWAFDTLFHAKDIDLV